MKKPFIILSLIFLSACGSDEVTQSSETMQGLNQVELSGGALESVEKAKEKKDFGMCSSEDPAVMKACIDAVQSEIAKENQENINKIDEIYSRAKTQKNAQLCDEISIESLKESCRVDAIILSAVADKNAQKCQELKKQEEISSCEQAVESGQY